MRSPSPVLKMVNQLSVRAALVERPRDGRRPRSTSESPSLSPLVLPSRVAESDRTGPDRDADRGRGPASVASVMSSSSLSSWYASYRGLEGEPRARERTTSPLHMGHVRRLVVSQGVLQRD